MNNISVIDALSSRFRSLHSLMFFFSKRDSTDPKNINSFIISTISAFIVVLLSLPETILRFWAFTFIPYFVPQFFQFLIYIYIYIKLSSHPAIVLYWLRVSCIKDTIIRWDSNVWVSSDDSIFTMNYMKTNLRCEILISFSWYIYIYIRVCVLTLYI